MNNATAQRIVNNGTQSLNDLLSQGEITIQQARDLISSTTYGYSNALRASIQEELEKTYAAAQ